MRHGIESVCERESMDAGWRLEAPPQTWQVLLRR